jgi:transposase-like protein
MPWLECMVVIVVRDEELARQALDRQELGCPHPGCGGALRRDGHARQRRVRLRDGQHRTLRPQRVACRRCERVQVLLPAWCVPRHADDAETIGVALLHAAQGRSCRAIAAMLGRAVSTVRRWIRAAERNAQRAARHAFAIHRTIDSWSNLTTVRSGGSPLADAMADISAAIAALVRHLGITERRHDPWALFTILGGTHLMTGRRALRQPAI